MRKNKVFLLLAMVILLTLTIAGCSSGEENETANNGSSENQTYEINFAHEGPEATTIHQAFLGFEENVESRSNGRIQVVIYPAGQLGGARETMESVLAGDITMAGGGTSVMSNFVSDVSALELLFYLPSSKEETRAIFTRESPVGKVISAKAEEKGLKYLGAFDQGFRQMMYNGSPVRTPDDLNGMKFRVLESPYQIEAWTALGANPVPIAFPELFTSLQQGVVAGAENPYEVIYAGKYYDILDYVTETSHQFYAILLFMNLDQFNAMPEDLQQIFLEEFDKAAIAGQEMYDAQESKYKEELKAKGMEIIELTPEEQQKWVDKLAAVNEKALEEISPEMRNALESVLK